MNTISKQILTSLLVTVLVVLGGIGYLDIQNTMHLEKESLQADQKNITERLSYSLVYPLWNLNLDEVKKTIQNEAVEKNVRAILLYDEGKDLYAGVIREGSEEEITAYSPSNPLHQHFVSSEHGFTSREIIKNGKTIGKIFVYANTERLESVLQQQRLTVVFKLLGFLIVLSFVQFLVLRRIIIQPLTHLKEWVSSIGPDRMLPPPKLTRCEEIDALTTSFSDMTSRLTSTLDEIVEKNAELQKHKEELEDKNQKLNDAKDKLKKQIQESEQNRLLLAEEINERKQAQTEIIKLNTTLEERVSERTAQLEVAINDLSVARDIAEAATRAKSRFLANMSHEIRTPMNAILGYTQLMQRLPELSGKLKNYTTIIARSSDHLLGLINDVLEMSKIEAGSVTLQSEDLNLRALMKDVESMLKMRASEKGLTIDFEISHRIPDVMHADGTKLRQVLVNIIGNAIKFTDCGGIRICASVQDTNSQTIMVCIEITDTGPGIAEHEQSKVFDAFEQTESGHRKGGTGLGMAISRQYARIMGGDLTFDSVAHEGTTVYFTFSAKRRQDHVGVAPQISDKRIIGLAPESAQPKILIADDVESNREILRLMLEGIGFSNIREVIDGKAAQEMAQEWQPDIVLMDRRMPIMDGLQATRAIRSSPNGKNIQIIMVTASAFEEDRKIAMESGADGFVAKPFHEKDILREIQRLLPVVVYRYENNEKVMRPKLVSHDEWRTQAMKLDAGLLIQLVDLIECGDIARFEHAIAENLRERSPELHGHLHELAQKFDYARIMATLTPVLEQ